MAAPTKSKVEHGHQFNKKRKKDDDDGPLPTKESKKSEFNEIDFKFLLKNPSTLFSGLEKFAEAADSYTDGEYDIVEGYCRSAPECAEILQVLDAEKRKIQELQAVFTCLEKILLRIADDLKGRFYTCGMTIVRKLISSHMGSIYFTLNSTHKASQVKVTLKLLVAMVMLGPATSKLIVNNLDLTRSSIVNLFRWRDLKDDEDVRTCVIHLIIGLLLSADYETIRRLADMKGIFTPVFHGLMFDQVSLIQLLLSTVLEKIVLSTSISKTQRVNIFPEDTLRQLAMLFKWQGPQHWKSMLGSKRGKKPAADVEDVELDEDQEEQRALVANITHTFLVEVCSSYKHGIVFMDKTYGLSGRNQNHLLTSVLSYLVNISSGQPLVQDLAAQILVACPDQLQHFCQVSATSLSPRATVKWVDTVNFLYKVYDSLPREPHILKLKERRPVSDLVSILLLHTLPNTHVMRTLMPGVKDKSLAINHVTISIMKVIAARAVDMKRLLAEVLATERARSMYTAEECHDLITQYRETVVSSLPDVLTLFQFWDKQHQLSGEITDIAEKEQLAELCQTDQCGVQVRILQVLCLYQQLTPGLFTDHPVGLGKLLDGIIHQGNSDEGEKEKEDHSQLPQLYLLKLLSGTEAKRLPWGRKSKGGHTLIYQLLEMVAMATDNPHTQRVTRQLMCRLLEGTGLFEGCHEELSNWLKHLQLAGHDTEARSHVLDFLSQVTLTFIHNPHPYMERVGDLRSEVILMHSGKEGGSSSLEKKIEEILAGDVGSSDDREDASTQPLARLPFCPILLVAVDHLQKMDNISEGVTQYMSAVLLDTFHLQTDPQPLVAMVTGCQEALFTDGLCTYLKMWKSHEKDQSATKRSSILTKSAELTTVWRLSKVMSLLPSYDVISTPCDVINQYLLHLTYLSSCQGKNIQGLEVAFGKVVEMLQDKVRQIVDSEDTTNSEPLPEEFALLDTEKETAVEKQRAAIHQILNHPTVRQFFMIQADQEHGWLQVTEMVVELLDTVRQSEVKPELLDFYQTKVLSCLKSICDCDASSKKALTDLVLKSLKHIVQSIDAVKCVEVLETVLVVTETETSDSMYSVLDGLFEKLMDSDLRLIKLSPSACEAAVACVEKSKHVTAFFKKFPNLSVLCSNRVVSKVLSSSVYYKLGSLLMGMNGYLHGEIGEALTEMSREPLLEHLPLLLTYLNTSSNLEQVRQIGSHVVKVLKQDLLDLCTSSESPSTSLTQLCKTLIQKSVISKKLTTKMESTLVETLQSDRKFLPHQVELLDQLIGCHASPSNSEQAQHRLVQVCVVCLTNCLSDKQQRGQGIEDAILEILTRYTKDNLEKLTDEWKQFKHLWPRFVKVTLKHLYCDRRLLNFLANIVPEVYKDNREGSVTIDTLVAMVMSHTFFLPIMFNEESGNCKDPLLDLLIELIELSPQSCHSDHVRIFLGAYGASLSNTDQKLLKLLQMYEKNGIKFSDFKPFLWGEKAIEHHSLYKSMGPGLLQAPSMSKVVSNMDKARIQQSTLHFPLRRKLQGTDVADAASYKSSSDCYDPRFMFPLFSHLLTPDVVVDCRKFIEQGCLSYVLSALSSHDEAMRSAACHILESYHSHLDAARFLERDQIIYLLDFLHDSLPKPKVKLASIVTQFLARTATLMLQPGEHMYDTINSFLLVKPSLDVLNIPEFYKLFNSSALQYKTERAWILSMMLDGMRETADFRIYEKRYTFKLLQSFYDSEASDIDSQVKILQIIEAACRERTVAIDMTKNNNLVIWILLAINKLSSKQTQLVPHLVRLVNTLWFSMMGKGEHQREATPEIVLKTAFTSQVLSCLQACLWHFRDVKEEVLLSYSETLLSAMDYIEERSSTFQEVEDKIAEVPLTFSYVDILLLILQTQKYVNSNVSPHSIQRLLAAFGYDTSSLIQSKEGRKSQRKYDNQKMETANDANDGTDANAQSQDAGENDEGRNVTEEMVASKCSQLFTSLLKLVLKWKPCLVEGRLEESVAVCMTVMSWLVHQMEICEDVKLVSQGLQWLCRCLGDNDVSYKDLLVQRLVVKLDSSSSKSSAAGVSSSSAAAAQILTGLLGLYSKLICPPSDVWIGHSDEMMKVKETATEHLNNILAPVADAMFGDSTQEVHHISIATDPRMSVTDRKSLSLRCLFLSKPSRDGGELLSASDKSKSKKQLPTSTKKEKKQGKRKSRGKSVTSTDNENDVTMEELGVTSESPGVDMVKGRVEKRATSTVNRDTPNKKKRKSKG